MYRINAPHARKDGTKAGVWYYHVLRDAAGARLPVVHSITPVALEATYVGGIILKDLGILVVILEQRS